MPYLLLSPVFIYYAVFWLTPVISGMVEVFTDANGKITLLENFILMFESDLFGESVLNTATFAAISVVLQYFLALLLAVLLNRKFKGAKLLTFAAMIPMAITPTAVAILWKTGLVKEGWVNTVLLFLNLIEEPIVFLNAEGFMAVLLIILIDTWTVTPSVMIILLAGLQGMQKELKEAAYTFGAGKWRIFTDITLPILKPSIITSVILRLIAAIQVWAIAVMVLGFGRAPFLVERIAFYVDVVPGIGTSEKIAFTLSFTTTVIVLLVTVLYLKVSKYGTGVRGNR
ncbi:MAG: sugar ABC transporter permease [Clostridiaceae bacterium]|jgi:multiple sugar transport system permease protein|nr:sugar ABC transporter permease [Clostridiaceae bacterium]